VSAAAAADTGGSLTPGSATGNNELVVNGNLVLSAGANFQIVGTFANFTPGNTYSFLIASATIINGGNTTNSYDIKYSANPTQFDVSNFTGFTPGVFDMEVHNVGTNEYFNLTPVPEPSSLLLVGAGAAGLGWYRRRRRAK
jgi:hypothetical protein